MSIQEGEETVISSPLFNLQDFYDLLEAHDWTFRKSDDHGAWKKGNQESATLNILADHDAMCHALLKAYSAYIWMDEPKPKRPTIVENKI